MLLLQPGRYRPLFVISALCLSASRPVLAFTLRRLPCVSQVAGIRSGIASGRGSSLNVARAPSPVVLRGGEQSLPQDLVEMDDVDPEYPGTAVQRLKSVHARIAQMSKEQLNADWPSVRRSLLWAGGLRDLPNAVPGRGYTGHSFNDYNHCDLTTMQPSVANNENRGLVQGIAFSNQLGPGIQIASIEELGPGGSWSTCMQGCASEPPADVAHRQFRSRIAFKFVWCPPTFTSFVLVDDAGQLLAQGRPSGGLPPEAERRGNFALVRGSKYAAAAEAVGAAAAKAVDQ